MTITPVTAQRPLEWFKPDERELARHDDPEKIRLTGQDMLATLPSTPSNKCPN